MELAIKILGIISAAAGIGALAIAGWHTWKYEAHRHFSRHPGKNDRC